MKRIIVIIALSLAFGGVVLFSDARAESLTEKYLGKREKCIKVSRIRETNVLDDQTILFEMIGGDIYVNRLGVPCFGLRISNGFSYKTSTDSLCKMDSFKVIEHGSGLGSTCLLGEFVLFKQKGMLSDVTKLLKEGLLDSLVEEKAFKETFPAKKPDTK